jgi:NAD(P)-dependent dehydrogenase (short-subunit alcohol dehydrogenase family)
MKGLNGKVAVVLGASAEGGTGWAIAQALAEHGAKVVMGARSFERLKALATRIDATAVACDAAVESQVANLAAQARGIHGRLDIAVNSAGFSVLGQIAAAKQETVESSLRINYFGNVYFIKHMAEAMQPGGSIVIISSLAATHPILPHFAYACAKAASECLVRYAAMEYGARGIRVNSIQPGPIVSDLGREHFATPGVPEAYLREIPLRRLGYPADFADAVLWLAGPAYITGHNLPVNGGMQLTRFPYVDELPGGAESYGDIKALFDRERAAAPK